jgi:RimJ/RimL family protein N-acetyltransferase
VTLLETERLRMPPLGREHTAALAEIYADPEVARYIGGARLSADGTREQVELFADEWRTRGYGQSAAILKATGELVGRIGLHYWPEWDEVELGYVLRASAQGQGLAREGSLAWIDYAFAELGVHHLIAVIDPDNDASLRLAQRLGFVADRRDVTPRGVEVEIYRLDRLNDP